MNDEVEELEVIVKKIRYKGIVWIPEPIQKQGQHVNKHPKQNYFVKWLHKNKQVGDLFTLEEFYIEYPKHGEDMGCKRRVEKVLSKYIRVNLRC